MRVTAEYTLTMQALLNTAIKAARAGGDISMRYLHRIDELKVETKARNEFVSQVDRAAEDAIIESIRERYPEHAVLAEESGASGDSEHVWIIDPLDGTTNFVHGCPVFSVSIALRIKGRLEIGVVYDPSRQELFTTIRGQGAQLDGRRIRVSRRTSLDGALIGTGFPYRSHEQWLRRYMNMFESVLKKTAGVRRPGSAALDLAWLAAGRFDGFWEFDLQLWDIAAGSLMVREAGGLISEVQDRDYLETGNVVAGAPKVHDALKALLVTHL